jgi:hypothetical protein
MNSLTEKLSSYEHRLTTIESLAISLQTLLTELANNHPARLTEKNLHENKKNISKLAVSPSLPIVSPLEPANKPSIVGDSTSSAVTDMEQPSGRSVPSVPLGDSSEGNIDEKSENHRMRKEDKQLTTVEEDSPLANSTLALTSSSNNNFDTVSNLSGGAALEPSASVGLSASPVEMLSLETILTPPQPVSDEPLPEEWKQSLFDDEMENLIAAIAPYQTQIAYRLSALTLLKKQIRLALGTAAYEIGFFPIRCFLPADPIRLTVVVPPSQVANWFQLLSERLKIIVEDNQEISRLANEITAEDGSEGKILVNHNLRNVSCIQEAAVPGSPSSPTSVGSNINKVVCAIDSLDVEITVNNRLELCFLAFLEEVSGLVGQNHLFKRSFLLIRSWWFYETANYAKTQIKHFIPDFGLSVMIVSIFNRFHKQISNPLTALLVFLREFSTYDGRNQAISIQGFTAFQSETSNQPKLILSQADHLINEDIYEKYFKLFNTQDALNAETPSGMAKPVIGPQQKQDMIISSLNRVNLRFERYGWNIVHPFLQTNLMNEKLSSRKLTVLSKVFSIGFSSLNNFLQQCLMNPIQSTEMMRLYFPTILSRFVSVWRPDALNNAIALPGTDLNW